MVRQYLTFVTTASLHVVIVRHTLFTQSFVMKPNFEGITRLECPEISKEEPLRRFTFLLVIWSIVFIIYHMLLDAYLLHVLLIRCTAIAQWLRCCATNRKVAGSIPTGVSEFFTDIKSFLSHYGPGVDSASNRNEYQEYFLGVKAAGA